MIMLNCRDVTERASDFLDARLPFRVSLQMRMHLLMCRFCREYLRQMALVVRALRRLPAQEAPSDELKRELLRTLDTEGS
jgi:predicted anti-sigma-YlaC factor YlaD